MENRKARIVYLLVVVIILSASLVAVLHFFQARASNGREAISELGKQNTLLAEGVWDETAFTVDVGSLADNKTAIWNITKDGTASTEIDISVPYDRSAGVITVFERQPEQKRKRGIFIQSWTYAIPDTSDERQWMTEHIYRLYKDKEWRQSESALIEELRTECEKKNIPLLVNLSGDLRGKWKKLVSSK